MKRPVIGVFGPLSDPEVRVLAARLYNRGADPWIIDLARVPDQVRLAWSGGEMLLGGRSLLEVDAAFLRRTGRTLPPGLQPGTNIPPLPRDSWDGFVAKAAGALALEHPRVALRTALLTTLARHRPVVNPPHLQRLHRLKFLLLNRLARAGVPIPESAVGVSPLVAGQDPDALVAKPLAGIYKTRLLHPEPQNNPIPPFLVQRRVRGELVRAYVLNRRVLAAARIVFGTTVDSSESQTGIAPVHLSEEAESVALRAARAVQAPFCGLDIMLETDTGRCFVIDLNLSPMFAAFSRLSGRDIAASLADHLLDLAAVRIPLPRRPALEVLEQAKELLAAEIDRNRCERWSRGAPGTRGTFQEARGTLTKAPRWPEERN